MAAVIHKGFVRHPKIVGLSDAAFRLWCHSWAYCQEHLTDGLIPKPDTIAKLGAILAVPCRVRAENVAELLAIPPGYRAGLWEDCGDHYRLHDYLDWSDSRQQVQRDRAALRERVKRARDKRRNALCNAVTPRDVTPSVTQGSLTSDHRPLNKEPVQGADAAPPPDPDDINGTATHAFIRAFCDLWKAAHGGTYKIKPAKHVPLVRSLLKTYGHDRLLQLANGLQTVEDKWIGETDRGIEILSSQINKLELWCAEEEARYAQR